MVNLATNESYSWTMVAEQITEGIQTGAPPNQNESSCLAVINFFGGAPKCFRIRPLDKTVAESLSVDSLVGLLSNDNVIWCRKGQASDDEFELNLMAVPSNEVITVNVAIVIPPAVVDGDSLRQLVRQVAVEGPAEKLPARIVLTLAELNDRPNVAVRDLRLPVFCETIGVALDEVIAFVPEGIRARNATTIASQA